MGFMDLAQIFGLTLGPVFAGLMYDVTGSYRLAFIAFAVTAAIAMMLMLIARRPANTPSEATVISQ
jgi:cyanate permease